MERRVIEGIGRGLDKFENILRKRGKPFDFYDITYIAQNPREWLQRIKNLQAMP